MFFGVSSSLVEDGISSVVDPFVLSSLFVDVSTSNILRANVIFPVEHSWSSTPSVECLNK